MLRLTPVLAALTLVVGSATPAAAVPTDPMPLGPAGLSETRTVQQVAPGVQLTTVTRGAVDVTDAYTVQLSTRLSKADSDADVTRARAAGAAVPEQFALTRPTDDPRPGPYAWVVRDGGRYPQTAQATALASVYQQNGFPQAKAVHTSEDGLTAGHVTTGPWVVQVMEVDPAMAHLQAALGTDVVDAGEKTSSMVARRHALGGLNGNFFVNAAGRGQIGDVAGLSVVEGAFTGESLGSQPVLAARNGVAAFEDLRTRMTLTSGDGATAPLRGWDRAVGTIEGCGNAGAGPTEDVRHDTGCTNADDLVAFDARWSTGSTPTGVGVEVVVGADGRVTSAFTTRGRPVPAGSTVIAGTGTSASWLTAHAPAGASLTTDVSLLDPAGTTVPMPEWAVGGGALLLRGGTTVVRGVADGFAYDANPEFWHRFALRRNNRSLVGRRADGTLLLIAVDGRTPASSVGATFDEEVALLRWAGAVDGMNLDGGGSTTMVIGDGLGSATVTNHPTDATGERAVGDALLVFPGSTSTPDAVVPEVPSTTILPLSALALAIVFLRRRRRSTSQDVVRT